MSEECGHLIIKRADSPLGSRWFCTGCRLEFFPAITAKEAPRPSAPNIPDLVEDGPQLPLE